MRKILSTQHVNFLYSYFRYLPGRVFFFMNGNEELKFCMIHVFDASECRIKHISARIVNFVNERKRTFTFGSIINYNF